jgi:large-conductance mechanosensitive channel
MGVQEQTANDDQAAAAKTGRIVRIVLQWLILGLVLFTVVMAAIKKFAS